MKIDSQNLLNLKLRSILKEFRSESVVLWFLCFYILIEYIRPQNMYQTLDVLPWGQTSILVAVISVFLSGSKANGHSMMDVLFATISIFIIFSGIFAWDTDSSLKYLTTFVSWILMYFCIISVLTTPKKIFLFIIFFIIINFKLSQHGASTFAMRGFGFTGWGLAGPPGWFSNSGEFALQMVVLFSISLSILIASKKYIESNIRWTVLMFLFPGTAALTVIGSSSRGGQIALAAVIIVLLFKQGRFFRLVFLFTTLATLALYFLPEEQLKRMGTIGYDQTSQLRLQYWGNALETIKQNPWGIGYENWLTYYPAHFDVDRVERIHNTLLQAFVEQGYHGGSLFILMLITTFVMNARTSREMNEVSGFEAESMAAIALGINLSLLGTIVAALFMSVLYYPVFWLAFALTSALRQISKNKITESIISNKISEISI